MKKHKILYLLSISSFAVIISMLPAASVYAGDLNEQERDVLAVLKEPFEYNGQTYAALPGYLQLAREYLLNDHINLTPEQKGKAIAAIRTNVEMAISSGFIVPLEKEPKEPAESREDASKADADGTEQNSPIDENKDKFSSADSSKDHENSVSGKESVTSDSDKELSDEGTHDLEKTENNIKNIMQEEVKTADNQGIKEESTQDRGSGDIGSQDKAAQDKAGALTDGRQPNGGGTGENEDFMIKDTGYHVNSIVIFLGMLLSAVITAGCCLLHQITTAKKNE